MTMDPRVYDPSQDINAQTFAEVQQAKAAGFRLKDGSDLEFDLAAGSLAAAIQNGNRAFIAPVHKNDNILIHSGKPTVVVAQTNEPAVPGLNYPDGTEIRRLGDIFVRFVGGICILEQNDPYFEEKVAWCEEHEEICRDATDPKTDTWATLKEGQTPLKDKEASMDRSLDVDAIMRGDYSSFMKVGSLAARARAILAGDASLPR